MLLYIIMNRLDSDRLPFHSTQAEYWKDWLNNKIENRDLAWRVKSKLLNQIRELEQENRNLKNAKESLEEYQKILKVMKKHGLNAWYNVAETLDTTLTRPYPVELDIVLNQLQVAIKEIDKLKSKGEIES
jgi:ribosomal protein S20